ncbi:MAG TPA: outer membrane protein assembly factor BamC [Burkholderiaceae bacterium]
MTKHTISPRSTLVSCAVLALLASLSGCQTLSTLTGGGVDYKTSGQTNARALEVPPDLTQLARDNRYAIPDPTGVATASNQAARAGAPVAAAGTPGVVAPLSLADVRIERTGNTRWLVAKRSPEQLFPAIKEFWQSSGFVIVSESAQTGTLETDWLENRSKIPQDALRRTLGRVFDGLYSTGERDKYRTRLERTPDGGTEIYISHRGAEEVITGPTKETTAWTVRPNDPNLEAQFLSRLMAHLGAADVEKAQTVVAAAAPQAIHAKLVGEAGTLGSHVHLDEGFDRAWRRAGLALDRAGFTVEDRDRVAGVYFVRYVDNDSTAPGKGQPGFLKRLFSFGSADKATDAQRYRIWLKGDSANVTQVVVLNNESKPEVGSTAAKILNVLFEQLK